MVKRFNRFSALVAVVTAVLMTVMLASCSDDMYDNSPDGPLVLSLSSITVGNAATKVYIGVTARDGAWEMTGSESWCTADPARGDKGTYQITVTFAANEGVGEEPPTTRTATFTFSSGGETKTVEVTQLDTEIVPPNQNADLPVNRAIHEELLNTWYYNGETRTADADYNQSYRNFYTNYLSFLTQNTLDGNFWEKTQDRYIYSRIERHPRGMTPSHPLNYGMEFDLGMFDGRLVARILYVLRGSPAEAAGLKRGDWFYKVHDVQMGDWVEGRTGWRQYNRIIDSIVHPVAGESPKLGMLSYQSFSGRLYDENRSVVITPSDFSASPILYSNSGDANPIVLDHVDGHTTRTGYMVYNSFDPEYRQELLETFAGFKSRELTDFVLDLRYNSTGTVEMAELMGNLLVGDVEGVDGKIFARYEFYEGSEAVGNNRTAVFEPHESSLGMDTLYIITSGRTAGASELLINAIAGLKKAGQEEGTSENMIKLIVIGEKTEGMNVGTVERTYSTDEYDYRATIAAFRCYNAEGNGDYKSGFTPNGGGVNLWQGDGAKWSETWNWKYQDGSTRDPWLEKAMEYIRGREQMPVNPVSGTAVAARKTGYMRQYTTEATMTMETVAK